MTTEQVLNIVTERGIKLDAVGDKLVFKAPRGVMDEKIKSLLRAHKPELLAFLRSKPAINYEFCRSRDCPYFMNHRANPRCLHPLCTKCGKHPAGLWIYDLVECPAETGHLRWKN